MRLHAPTNAPTPFKFEFLSNLAKTLQSCITLGCKITLGFDTKLNSIPHSFWGAVSPRLTSEIQYWD